MLSSLGKRVAALEQAKPQHEDLTMLITFVGMSREPKELHALRTYDGKHVWRRAADESESEFTARAEREAPRTEWGVAMLIEIPNDTEEA